MLRIAIVTLCLLASRCVPAMAGELTQDATIQSMLAENNRQRAARGLPPHEISIELTNAAQDHAFFMSKHGMNHYSNGGPGGRAARYGHRGGVMENIAYGPSTVAGAFGMWVRSSGHAANLFSGSRKCGLGCYRSSGGTWFWCALYSN